MFSYTLYIGTYILKYILAKIFPVSLFFPFYLVLGKYVKVFIWYLMYEYVVQGRLMFITMLHVTSNKIHSNFIGNSDNFRILSSYEKNRLVNTSNRFA